MGSEVLSGENKREIRKAFRDNFIKYATIDERLVYLDADLINSMSMADIEGSLSKRVIDCGIQEANMAGVAAGLSATGMIPFIHSFAVFSSRRMFDQVFVSCAFARRNVKIIGSDPGITASYNGATHMSFEDIGTLRSVPGLTIIEPTDSVMLDAIFEQIYETYGVHYLRLARKQTFTVYKPGTEFKIGKAALLREGRDVTIIAEGGICVSEALKAAAELESEGISTRVLDMFTLKPADRESIIKAAKETGAIVTVENHSIYNGLGSAVAEVTAEEAPVPLVRIGVNDRFGEVGDVSYLAEKFGLTKKNIVEAARRIK